MSEEELDWNLPLDDEYGSCREISRTRSFFVETDLNERERKRERSSVGYYSCETDRWALTHTENMWFQIEENLWRIDQWYMNTPCHRRLEDREVSSDRRTKSRRVFAQCSSEFCEWMMLNRAMSNSCASCSSKPARWFSCVQMRYNNCDGTKGSLLISLWWTWEATQKERRRDAFPSLHFHLRS